MSKTPAEQVIDAIHQAGGRSFVSFEGAGNASRITMYHTSAGMVLVQEMTKGGVDVYLPATKGLELAPMLDALRRYLAADAAPPTIAEALQAARDMQGTEPCAANLPLFNRFTAILERLEQAS